MSATFGGQTTPGKISAYDVAIGGYSVSINATAEGTWTVEAALTSEGTRIGAGVSTWTVQAAAVHLPSSFIEGEFAGGGDLTAGVSSTVGVRFRDRFGNPVVSSPGSVLDGLAIKGVGASGGTVAVTFLGGDEAQVEIYCESKGMVTVHVMGGGEHVQGSPVGELAVVPAGLDVAMSGVAGRAPGMGNLRGEGTGACNLGNGR